MDFNTSLRRAIKTGNVSLGQNSTTVRIEEGTARLVVLAENCPETFRASLESIEDIPQYVYEGSGVQLGKACGRSHVVSALAVVDPGESDILNIKRE